MSFKVLVTLALIASAAAQCVRQTRDLVTLKDLPPNGFRGVNGWRVDNAGGTYGGVGLTYTYQGAAGARIVPTDPKDGYWFFKFEPRECWDATGYNAFEFDFQAPVGSVFFMTLTVHTSACLTANCTANPDNCPRQPDSTYVNINATNIPNGRMQHAVVPFSLFASNSFGNGTTDFKYIKDFTFISFSVINQPYIFNNFVVKAGGCAPTGLPPAPVATATAPTRVAALPGATTAARGIAGAGIGATTGLGLGTVPTVAANVFPTSAVRSGATFGTTLQPTLIALIFALQFVAFMCM